MLFHPDLASACKRRDQQVDMPEANSGVLDTNPDSEVATVHETVRADQLLGVCLHFLDVFFCVGFHFLLLVH